MPVFNSAIFNNLVFNTKRAIAPVITRGGISPTDYKRYRKQVERLEHAARKAEEEKIQDRKELEKTIRQAFKVARQGEEIGIETEALSQAAGSYLGNAGSVYSDESAIIAYRNLVVQTQRILAELERVFSLSVRQRMQDEEIAILLLC